MSFDIFLQCFQRGEPATFDRKIFDEIFLPYCTHPALYRSDPGDMTVEFPDGSGGQIYPGSEIGDPTDDSMKAHVASDQSKIQCVMFNHCGGTQFFQAMYELANRTSAVIFWPSVRPSTVVTKEAVLKELPDDFPKLADAKIVRSGADIVKAIEES
jgi:hypothetical protein